MRSRGMIEHEEDSVREKVAGDAMSESLGERVDAIEKEGGDNLVDL